jgi:hypothetical protein
MSLGANENRLGVRTARRFGKSVFGIFLLPLKLANVALVQRPFGPLLTSFSNSSTRGSHALFCIHRSLPIKVIGHLGYFYVLVLIDFFVCMFFSFIRTQYQSIHRR